MSSLLPLFPLRTVLFPAMPLPLRIFEERYLTMTKELLHSGGSFGVLLIKQGRETGDGAVPFDVGTTAVIRNSEEVEGGQMIISCRGMRRFRLLRMLPPDPYPRGELEFLDDLPAASPELLSEAQERVERIFPEYFNLALTLTDQWARPFSLPPAPHALVDMLGPWLKIDETDKQNLLELEDAGERVARLANLLERLAEDTRSKVVERHRRRYGGMSGRN